MPTKAVVVITRHGARFPSHSPPNNLSLPQSKTFWNSHGMTLTPFGSHQLYTTGQQLAKDYPHLLSDVEVFSTNSTRTIMSALALLDGMLPSSPKYVSFNGDSDRDRSDYNYCDGIEVQVESSKSTDTLFNMGKDVSEYTKWKSMNIRTSPTLRHLANSREVINLLDKLSVMTGDELLSPTCDPISRITRLTSVLTLLRCAETSNSVPLPNRLGLRLSKNEIELIEEVTDEVYYHSFNSSDGQIRVGTWCVGQLLSLTFMYLRDVRDGLRGEGINIYSAHDTTLLALMSALGFRAPCPGFAAYLSIQLLSDDRVRVDYSTGGVTSQLIHIDELSDDLDTLASLTDCFTLERLRDVLLGQSVDCNAWPIDSVQRVFNYYDSDRDGVISDKEFELMLRRLGWKYVSKSEVLEIRPVHTLDLHTLMRLLNIVSSNG